jgi:signal transduction histidine kinase
VRRPPADLPWAALLAAATDAILVYDAAGQLAWANPAAVAVFGVAPTAPAAGGPIVCDVQGNAMARSRLPETRALSGETVQGERFTIVAATGPALTLPATAVPLRVGETITGAAVLWRTAAAHESLRQPEPGQTLSRRLVEAQEEERKRIARELHDEVGQALTAVKINLQAIAHQNDAPAAAARLADSIAVVERALQQVRNISLDLRPSLLDDLGLVSALRWYVDSQARRAGLAATFSADPPTLRLAAGLETDCFRVAQEALTNVIRHAHATRVEVSLQGTGHGVRLVIRDNGVGFDVAHALAGAGRGESLGLIGLRERVALASGRMEIVSAPGGGAEVRAWFPSESR